MLDLSKDEKAKAGWLRPRCRAVDRAAARPFSANGSDAVLMEFAVARHDRKIIGKRSCDDDSVGRVFVEVWQLGGMDHDVVSWRNGVKTVLFLEVCDKVSRVGWVLQ